MDLISQLNTQIGEINIESIQKHTEKGDLKEWLSNWQTETGAVSFSLFFKLKENGVDLGNDGIDLSNEEEIER